MKQFKRLRRDKALRLLVHEEVVQNQQNARPVAVGARLFDEPVGLADDTAHVVVAELALAVKATPG